MLSPAEAESIVNKLGEKLRELMERRNLSGVDLAAQVEISPTALSQILNGVTKPRHSTFTRLYARLCVDSVEQTQLIAAYTGKEPTDAIDRNAFVPEIVSPKDAARVLSADTNEAAAERYLEVKAASIAFETDVAQLLDEARIPVIHPFVATKVVCDFVTKGKVKIAIDCKYNLAKDWDRLLGTCLLLKKNLPVEHVLVAIPYHNATSRAYEPDFTDHGIRIETPHTLVAALKQLGA